MMRVLMVNYEFPPIGGGASPVCYQLTRHLVKMGVEVDFVTAAYGNLPLAEVIDGIHLTRVPCARSRPDICKHHEMLSFVYKATPVIARMMDEKKYDLIQCHFLFPTAMIFYRLRRRIDMPLIVMPYGSDVPGYNPDRFGISHVVLKPLWRRIVTMPQHITTNSHFLKDLIIQQLGYDPGNITRIPSGYEARDFDTTRSRQKRILTVTRLLPRKGVQYLIEAMAGTDLPDWELAIVGDGINRDELETLAANRQVKARFYGWLDNQSRELRDLYETSSIYVLHSLVENFPTAILEAMSAGLPVVTTAGTGCAEVVGEAGVTTPPKDVDALRAAVLDLAADLQKRVAIGSAARQRVLERFNWERIAGEHLAMFEKSIAAHNA